MSEKPASVRELSADSRATLAAQIRRARFLDRNQGYVIDREGVGYINEFRGLSASLDHIRSNVEAKTVLDIGAGKTRGAFELGLVSATDDLQVRATVMSYDPDIANNLGIWDDNRVHITPAELLRGIPNESVGGILALYSATYSSMPQQVVRRMDEVLAPAGVVKMVCVGEHEANKYNAKTAQEYEPLFAKLGYSTVTYQPDITSDYTGSLLLAVKPGAAGPMDESFARNLFEQDFRTRSDQVHQMFTDLDERILVEPYPGQYDL